jgi:hypothetical protein
MLSSRSALISMNFDAFRDWALAASRRAALRWEDAAADEIPVVNAQDEYGDLHEIAIPPIYIRHNRGHIGWMAQGLPAEVGNRSLFRLCLRISAWTGDGNRYADLSTDPDRSELLLNVVAEPGRREVWQARIHRDKSGLPKLDSWHQYDAHEFSPLLQLIDDALRRRKGKRGPTMPAANMVLGPYDVPRDFFPDYRGNTCGSVEWVTPDSVVSSYKVSFRPERPDHVILSLCYFFTPSYGLDGHIEGALGSLRNSGNKEVAAPKIGERAYAFDGLLDNGRLHKYQVLWCQGSILCELGLVGPPGYFKLQQLNELAAMQNSRLRGELRAPLTSAG